MMSQWDIFWCHWTPSNLRPPPAQWHTAELLESHLPLEGLEVTFKCYPNTWIKDCHPTKNVKCCWVGGYMKKGTSALCSASEQSWPCRRRLKCYTSFQLAGRLCTPITALLAFQDSLTIEQRNTPWIKISTLVHSKVRAGIKHFFQEFFLEVKHSSL